MPDTSPADAQGGIGFTCACCGQRHDGLPDLAYTAPAYRDPLLAQQDSDRNRLDEDCCVVGGTTFFIRCVLAVPILGTDESLGWGVWITQSEASFRDYIAHFKNTPERGTFGYLANRLPTYPDTLGLETQAPWQSDGRRPWVELRACDHPLCRDWRHGITRERAIEFVQLAHHPVPG